MTFFIVFNSVSSFGEMRKSLSAKITKGLGVYEDYSFG